MIVPRKTTTHEWVMPYAAQAALYYNWLYVWPVRFAAAAAAARGPQRAWRIRRRSPDAYA
jgi:hypothetical protein